MNYPGLTINTDKIAEGLYEMIKEHPDGACMRLGMFPALIMTCLEDALKSRIPDSYLDHETLEAIDGKAIRQEVEHEICCKILSLATDEGFCIV